MPLHNGSEDGTDVSRLEHGCSLINTLSATPNKISGLCPPSNPQLTTFTSTAASDWSDLMSMTAGLALSMTRILICGHFWEKTIPTTSRQIHTCRCSLERNEKKRASLSDTLFWDRTQVEHSQAARYSIRN